MKRSAALASLSRDHHQALVVALGLRRASGETAAGAREAFLTYWSEHGNVHFRLEEEILLPGYAAYGDSHHPVVLAVLGDHVAIRRLAGAIADRDATHSIHTLHELGERLAAHVRLEERELFPIIEAAVPAPELAALAARLDP